MTIERRRVQTRGAASIKKQGVGAIQPVTEQACKGVKRRLCLRNSEYDFAIRAYAHTIARFERRAAPVETRVQAPIYHQHRPGLRRQVRLGALLEKRSGLHDGRPVAGYIKNPI